MNCPLKHVDRLADSVLHQMILDRRQDINKRDEARGKKLLHKLATIVPNAVVDDEHDAQDPDRYVQMAKIMTKAKGNHVCKLFFDGLHPQVMARLGADRYYEIAESLVADQGVMAIYSTDFREVATVACAAPASWTVNAHPHVVARRPGVTAQHYADLPVMRLCSTTINQL